MTPVASSPMMATTTTSSIKVKALLRMFIHCTPLLWTSERSQSKSGLHSIPLRPDCRQASRNPKDRNERGPPCFFFFPPPPPAPPPQKNHPPPPLENPLCGGPPPAGFWGGGGRPFLGGAQPPAGGGGKKKKGGPPFVSI